MTSDEIRRSDELWGEQMGDTVLQPHRAIAFWIKEVALQLAGLRELLSQGGIYSQPADPRLGSSRPPHFFGESFTPADPHPTLMVRVYDAAVHIVMRIDRRAWDEHERAGTLNPNWIPLREDEKPPAEPLCCSNCKERIGQQHKPSCHRQGVVTRESVSEEVSHLFLAKRFLETAEQFIAFNMAADETDARNRKGHASYYPTPRPQPAMIQIYSAAIPILRGMVAHVARCKLKENPRQICPSCGHSHVFDDVCFARIDREGEPGAGEKPEPCYCQRLADFKK